MKTKLFLSIVIALVVSSNVSASNPKEHVFTNVVNTAAGYNKELTIFNSSNMQDPAKKVTCVYDVNGTLQEKVTYEWESYKGWIVNNKTEYAYNNDGKLLTVAFTRWDKESKSWSKTSDVTTYEEDRANMTQKGKSSDVKTSTDLAAIEIK